MSIIDKIEVASRHAFWLLFAVFFCAASAVAYTFLECL